MGATGLGGSTYVDTVIIGKVFEFNQDVIHGFDRSGPIRKAMKPWRCCWHVGFLGQCT